MSAVVPLVPVPCNGCTACCRYGLIFLRADDDDVASYETTDAFNPISGEIEPALKHKPDGGCVYLDASGCSIHDRAPAICREFDCREFYLQLPRIERRKIRSTGGVHKAVLDAARVRLSWRGEGGIKQ